MLPVHLFTGWWTDKKCRCNASPSVVHNSFSVRDLSADISVKSPVCGGACKRGLDGEEPNSGQAVYNLRRRNNDFELPNKTNHLTDCNFIRGMCVLTFIDLRLSSELMRSYDSYVLSVYSLLCLYFDLWPNKVLSLCLLTAFLIK